MFKSPFAGKAFQAVRNFLTVGALVAGLGIAFAVPASAQNEGLIVKTSDFGVTKTVDRLGIALQRKGIGIFGRVNHAKGAAGAGMDLGPNEVLIFGSPKIGTPLMQSNPAIGLDLPLKAVVWQDADGTVKLAYTDPAVLAKRYGIADKDKVFQNITNALNNFTNMATKRGALPKE